LTIALYPMAFLASMMSLGAMTPSTPFENRALMIGILIYPLLWVVMWGLSWWAVRSGRSTLAMMLSAPPALVFALLAAFVAFYFLQWGREMVQDSKAYSARIENVRRQNPLAGEILAFEENKTTWPALQNAISGADTASLSKPVEIPEVAFPGMAPRHETPLGEALIASMLVSSFDSSKARPHFLEAARLLIGRGAKLSAEEESKEGFSLVWMADVVGKGTELPDRKAETENPLVWRIMTASVIDDIAVSSAIYDAAHHQPELLNRPTTTYGTPVRAALLRGFRECVRTLVANGGHLSDLERKVPGVAERLAPYQQD
jgi:hypothetical protein